MLSDTKLLHLWQAGDQASFETLFLTHYERVYGVLFRLSGNRADAEDLAQQVFLKLYRAPKQIQTQNGQANIAGWLYRVAINAGYNALRRQRRQAAWQEKLSRLWPFDTAAPDPGQQVEQLDAQAKVRQILAMMKPRDAQLLLLRHSGFSYQELAMILNVAPGSIGSLLTRAERAFREKYQRAFPQEGDSV